MPASQAEFGPIALPSPLPDTIPECHQLMVVLYDRILELEKQARRRKRDIHGPRSAKVSKDALEGEGREIYDKTCKTIDAERDKRGQPPPPTHGGGGRKAPQLAPEQQVLEHKETDNQRLFCTCCNATGTAYGFRVSYQLEYVPGRFVSVKHVEYSYGCPKCKKHMLTTRKPLAPIDKGYPGPGLLAYVINNKYRRHLPNYRQESEMATLGMPAIKRSTISRWQLQSAELLRIIVDRMQCLILESRVIESDETTMPFIRKGAGHAIKGKISIYRGDETRPYTLYNFTEDGKGENHSNFLPAYKGFLLTDGSSVFNSVLKDEKEKRDGATSSNCWSHVGQYFEDAKRAEEKLADYALGIIKSIFKIERFVMTLPENERVAVRQQFTRPLLDQFKEFLDAQNDIAAPTAFADAVKYTLNRWPALCRFLDHGFLKAHNNDSENGLRPAVLGRKNWLHAGSVAGGQAAAILMSIVQTCLRHNVEPFEYLKDVLSRLPETPTSQIDQFLPDVWKATREKVKDQQMKSA